MAPLVAVVAVVAAVLLSRSPTSDRVVLLPGPDGKSSGAVSLKTGNQEQLLDQSYASAEVHKNGSIAPTQTDAASVKAKFGDALAAMPPRPVSFVVNFAAGSGDTLTPESAEVLAQLRAVLKERPAPELYVIGHTDRVGKLEANDALSLQRANTVKAMLVADGIPADSIDVAGRGEREPLVATEDEVAEPANRRVQIVVR